MDSVADIYADRVIESEVYLVEQGAPKAEKTGGKRLLCRWEKCCK
jgi:hypothetical protein